MFDGVYYFIRVIMYSGCEVVGFGCGSRKVSLLIVVDIHFRVRLVNRVYFLFFMVGSDSLEDCLEVFV